MQSSIYQWRDTVVFPFEENNSKTARQKRKAKRKKREREVWEPLTDMKDKEEFFVTLLQMHVLYSIRIKF